MRTVLLLLGLSFLLPFHALSEIYYIRADGLGDHPTIQDAITASADRESVILLAGVYAGDGNRDASYQGKEIFVGKISGLSETSHIDSQGSAQKLRREFIFQDDLDGTTRQGSRFETPKRIGATPFYLNALVRRDRKLAHMREAPTK